MALGTVAVVLAGVVFFFLLDLDPTLRGLRPHATFDNLKTYSARDLSNLTSDPGYEAILVRDVWHSKGAASGWFALTGDDLNEESLKFSIRGDLDYNPTIFVSGPKRCGGTGQPAKAIIALEPNRTEGGFTGRSTCTRAKMNLAALIERATPLERHVWDQVPQSKYLELRARALSGDESGVLLGPINRALDAQPYQRRIYLPVFRESEDKKAYEIASDLRDFEKTLALPDGVSAQSSYITFGHIGHGGIQMMHIKSDGVVRTLQDLKLYHPFVAFRCSEAAKSYCEGLTAGLIPPELSAHAMTSQALEALAAKATPAENQELDHFLSLDDQPLTEVYLPPLNETRVSFEFYKLLKAE